MRRPGLWVANGQPEDTTQMYSWRPGAIACLYNHLAANDVFNYKAANPDAPVIIYFPHPPNWQQDAQASARQLGQFIADKWVELQPLDPYVYFANQANIHYANGDPNPANQYRYMTSKFYQLYGFWARTTADIIKDRVPEMKLITPPFAFGFNEDGSPGINGNPIKGWAGYDFLQETVRDYFDNTLAFNALWGYAAGGPVADWLYEPELSSWYAFRWQRVLQLFKTRYNIEAKVIISQTANFGPANPDFTNQLIYYAQECLSDARVLALTYFLWSDPSGDPLGRLNAWRENIPNLAEHLRRLSEMPDVAIADNLGAPEPTALTAIFDDPFAGSLEGLEELIPAAETPAALPLEVEDRTIRVLFEDGSAQKMAVEEYLRAVVPGEMPANWPDEALKAQAVAARSYAQYAIEHPRHHPTADICTTVHCQHYDPEKIHTRTDEAIQQTRGLVVLFEGKTVNTVFSARCGGHTRNNEDVWTGGRPVPYLRGVPCPDKAEKQGHGVGFCQHGARVFATQSRTFDQILRHYYQGVTLGPAPLM